MRRFRRDHLSDEAAERLLSGSDADSPAGAVARELREAGPTTPSESVAARHLAAIVAETRRPAETLVAPAPRRAALTTPMPVRVAAGATAFAAILALAVAGALPGPVQAAASDVLGVVGISVPDGRSAADQRKDAPAPARKRPARPAAPATVTLPDDVDQVTVPRLDDPAEAPREDDGGRRDDGDGDRGDDGGRDDSDRDRDDDRDGDDDDRAPSTEREPDEDSTSGEDDADDERGIEDEVHGQRQDSGEDPEDDSSGESDDEIDEPDEDRSGRSGGDLSLEAVEPDDD